MQYRTIISNHFARLAGDNQVNQMKEYLDGGIDVNYNNGFPLRWAVERGAYDSVIFLLKNGANPNVLKGWCIERAMNQADHLILLALFEYGGRTETVNNKYFIKKLIAKVKSKAVSLRDAEDIIFLIDNFNQIQNN